jgi:hypothetical protein
MGFAESVVVPTRLRGSASRLLWDSEVAKEGRVSEY